MLQVCPGLVVSTTGCPFIFSLSFLFLSPFPLPLSSLLLLYLLPVLPTNRPASSSESPKAAERARSSVVRSTAANSGCHAWAKSTWRSGVPVKEKRGGAWRPLVFTSQLVHSQRCNSCSDSNLLRNSPPVLSPWTPSLGCVRLTPNKS